MGRESGTSTGAAKAALHASERVKDQAGTDAALKKGALSEDQAKSITDAVAANPGAERSLLGKARTRSCKELRAACGRAKAAADPDPEATRRRQHAARSAKEFTDAEGLWNMHLKNTAEIGAEFKALVKPWLDGVFAQARRSGEREGLDAYLADAIAEMFRSAGSDGADPADGGEGADGGDRSRSAETGPVGGEPTGSEPPPPGGPSSPAAANESGNGSRVRPKRGSGRPDVKILAFASWEALVRGHTKNEERCEIAGVGSVPVSAVQALFGDAHLHLILTKAEAVAAVVNLSRPVTAAQRTALEARGYACAVPGCDATRHLDIDHVTGWAVTGRTELHDLDWLCRHHHDLKTYRGYRLGGPPGRRRWIAPETTDPPDRRSSSPCGRPPPNASTGRQHAPPGPTRSESTLFDDRISRSRPPGCGAAPPGPAHGGRRP